MRIIYKCPFTQKTILEVDSSALSHIGNTAMCPDCKIDHPLPICIREIKND